MAAKINWHRYGTKLLSPYVLFDGREGFGFVTSSAEVWRGRCGGSDGVQRA